MKPQPAFIWAQRTVHFNPKSTIDLNFSLVIHPGDTENNDPLGLNKPLRYLGLSVNRILVQDRLYRFHNFTDRLMEFIFLRIPVFNNI
jgi:hypothetical protein